MNLALAPVINQRQPPALTDLGSNHHNLGQLNALCSNGEKYLLQSVYDRNQGLHLVTWELPVHVGRMCVCVFFCECVSVCEWGEG